MPPVTGMEAFEKDQMRWQVANLSACHDLESGLRPGVNHSRQIDIFVVNYPCYENRENTTPPLRGSSQTPWFASVDRPAMGQRRQNQRDSHWTGGPHPYHGSRAASGRATGGNARALCTSERP